MADVMEIRISVRTLVEFLLRSGDISRAGYASRQGMLEGTRIHRKIQKEAGAEYQAEVRMSYRRAYDRFVLIVDGIADGVVYTAEGLLIDEIKSVSVPLAQEIMTDNPLHWAQAKCYAYILGQEHGSETVSVRLTYVHTETGKVKPLTRMYSLLELEDFFEALLAAYAVWATFEAEHKDQRNTSLTTLSFPFDTYRKGQREMAGAVYRAVRDKIRLFAQAPTGIGKTISALFPALKAMGEGRGDKIFYLTAKTVTRQVAEQALLRLEQKGMVLRSITLTSRERICRNGTLSCDPEMCSRAKGHYDRINGALYDILLSESWITRGVLISYADKHWVCPFEYGLDIALWCDAILCDYNHAFDPRAYLRRFFEQGGDYILLVDEAHNLVDRSREMFSAQLSKKAVLKARKKVKGMYPELYQVLGRINQYFIDLRKIFESTYGTQVVEFPYPLMPLVEDLLIAFEKSLMRLPNGPDAGLIDLFFTVLAFNTVSRLYDERYVTYAQREPDEVILKLFCVDPSFLLRKACSKGRTAVFFSATLLPLQYYQEMLGGTGEDPVLRLPSPFDREHLCVMAAPGISTRYKDRGESVQAIAAYIHGAVQSKTGNYLVFSPSYAYMRQIHECYVLRHPQVRTLMQGNRMDDLEREAFLSAFEEDPEDTLVGFAVMGGIFSEGIDLAGERLSGTVIVGVGLPQICGERDIIKDFFDVRRGGGFEYAYMFPGMNRVLQAAGRVIRTQADRGFVLLLDDRFLNRRYLSLFPLEWEHYMEVYSPEQVARVLERFWYSMWGEMQTYGFNIE